MSKAIATYAMVVDRDRDIWITINGCPTYMLLYCGGWSLSSVRWSKWDEPFIPVSRLAFLIRFGQDPMAVLRELLGKENGKTEI